MRICPFIDESWTVSYDRNDYISDNKYHRDDCLYSVIGDTLLEALFNMLKLLKEEETRNDKVKYFNC